MDRRRFLPTALAGGLAVPLAVGAQQTRSLPRIAYLFPSPPECRLTPMGQAFGQALSDAGYIPGQNVRWDRQCCHSGGGIYGPGHR
jgi:hypothetical protein